MIRSALRHLRSHQALLVALCGAVACSEGPASSGSMLPVQPPNHPLTSVAHLRGTVDVASGTMSFDPVSSTGVSIPGSGVNASIYGDQGVTVRIYNSAVVTSAPAGSRRES